MVERRALRGNRMTMWPVDKRFGDVKNNDPSLNKPISTRQDAPGA
jgi:hypothetical protein